MRHGDVRKLQQIAERLMGDEIELTDRERMVAREAAKIAVQEVANEFYRQVGKGVVTRVLVWIGMGAIGFAVANGWVTWGK